MPSIRNPLQRLTLLAGVLVWALLPLPAPAAETPAPAESAPASGTAPETTPAEPAKEAPAAQ